MNRWPSRCQLLLALACLGSAPCCSSYEPEGQFWPANGGPLTLGGSASPAHAGSAGQAAGTTAIGGTSNDVGGTGNDVSGTGNDVGGSPPLGGGNPVGGSAAFAGSDTFGGSTSIAGTGSVAGGSSVGGLGSVAGGSSVGGAPSQSCSLRVTVTTTAPGGTYQPRNVGAVWIADSTGRFLKSLEVWGNKRISRVVAWNTATRNAGVAGNKVDAVTSATLSTHRTHDDSWNCRDYNEQPVPDGTYRVYFEVADSNNGGPNIFETFNKGPSPSSMTTSMSNFQGIELTFTP